MQEIKLKYINKTAKEILYLIIISFIIIHPFGSNAIFIKENSNFYASRLTDDLINMTYVINELLPPDSNIAVAERHWLEASVINSFTKSKTITRESLTLNITSAIVMLVNLKSANCKYVLINKYNMYYYDYFYLEFEYHIVYLSDQYSILEFTFSELE